MNTRKLVVAGLVTSADDRVLITQRRADQGMPLKWEFPGGKIEAGESPEQALARELVEEIGARTRIGRIWDVLYHRYQTFELIMLVYPCRILAGEDIRCVEVQDLAWCRVDELDSYDILPADRPLIERLVAEGPPAW